MTTENAPMTAQEFADFIGCGVQRARKYLRDGDVHGAYKIGSDYRVDRLSAHSFRNALRNRLASQNTTEQRTTTQNNTEQH